MALKLIYGVPHGGHTEHIYEELIREAKAHPERRYIMLVPEQASLTVQEEMVIRHPDHALSNIDVLTFERLAHRVFKETRTETKEILDDEGKLLFLQLTVSRNRSRLFELRRSAGKIGVLDALKSVFSEFAEYNVSVELLKEKIELLTENRKLKRKLEDLALLYEEFLKLVHERFTLAEERMIVLGRAIRNWEAAADVTVALDGFTGFTPPQYEVIAALIDSCREVVLGLTVGTTYAEAENKDPEDLFHMPAAAAEKVKELAIRSGLDYTETKIEAPDPRPEALRFLEKHLFSMEGNAFPEASDAVRIVRGRTFREEITFVIREIKKSIREGFRYRDLAIVTGDLESYREELEERLLEADLPFFIDANKSLEHSPVIRLVTDAVRVCKHGFLFDAVFSYAKNPLILLSGGVKTGIDRVSEMENFALARGFRSKNGYLKTWEGGYRDFNPDRLAAVNETREAVMKPLAEFYDRMMTGKPTVAGRMQALKGLLDFYANEKALEKLAADYERESGEAIGKEYEAVTTFVTEFLDRAASIIGDLELSIEEFNDVILSGLSRAGLGVVPPTKDRLIVGNLTRTRLGHIQKLFVIGANEGKLPVTPDGSGLINDRDREALKTIQLSLAETAEENSCNNRYYLYLLLNEPMKALVMTYAAAENDGKGLAPAPVIGTLMRLFPEVQTEDAEQGYFPEVFSDSSGLYALSGALRALRVGEIGSGKLAPDEKARALYQWFRSSDLYAEALRQIDEGLYYHYQKELLPQELAKKLFGEVLYGSVSRLEEFAECPYRHFLHYGLEIRPQAVYELAAADLGTIAHASIERFFGMIREQGLDWSCLSEEEQEALITKSVDEVAADYGYAIFSDTARNEFLAGRIRRIMVRTLWALSKQWAAGEFTSTESELRFSTDANRELIELSPEAGVQLALSGRIDRIDLADDGEKIYVKVIDYKSGDHALDYTRIFHGIQLQLLLYMQVALKKARLEAHGKEVVPAGIYYYMVQDPFVEDATEESADELRLKSLRMKGLTNEDPAVMTKVDRAMADRAESGVVAGLKYTKDGITGALSGEELCKLGEFSVKKAEELSTEISKGVIEAAPYQYGSASGCQWCEFVGICGQDRRLATLKRRPLEEKQLSDLIGEPNPAQETEAGGGSDAGMD